MTPSSPSERVAAHWWTVLQGSRSHRTRAAVSCDVVWSLLSGHGQCSRKSGCGICYHKAYALQPGICSESLLARVSQFSSLLHSPHVNHSEQPNTWPAAEGSSNQHHSIPLCFEASGMPLSAASCPAQAAHRLQAEEGPMGAVRVMCSAYLDAWAKLHAPVAFVQPAADANAHAAVGIVRGGGPLLSLLLPASRAQQLLGTPQAPPQVHACQHISLGWHPHEWHSYSRCTDPAWMKWQKCDQLPAIQAIMHSVLQPLIVLLGTLTLERHPAGAKSYSHAASCICSLRILGIPAVATAVQLQLHAKSSEECRACLPPIALDHAHAAVRRSPMRA